ncbi:MAG: DUF2125 domain-containing protein [Alphaproteobacteria bacterium]|nr:DUF2125 domain-containing protein [Alphaproteobacteria bacterium]
MKISERAKYLVERPMMRLPLIGLAILIVVYCIAWTTTSFLLKGEIEKWIARQREAGATITHGDILVSGFPSRVTLTLPDWSMSQPANAAAWSWRTEAVRVWSAPWRPLAFTLDLAGRHEIGGARLSPVAWVMAGRADVRPELMTDGQLRSITVTIEAASLAEAVDAPPLASLERLHLAAIPGETEAPDPEPAWQLTLDASSVRWPESMTIGPFARDLERATINAQLIGEIAPGPLSKSLDAWRNRGGTLNLQRLELRWPPLGLSGSATIALDETLQPIGAGALTLTDFMETVDKLTEQDVLQPGAASAARVMLGLMARKPTNGGASEINLSLSIQDGKLSAGPLPLMEIPPIDWSALGSR